VYLKIYTAIVLSRNPETGEPEPWTFGVRRNSRTWKVVFGLATLVSLVFASRQKKVSWLWLIVAVLFGYLMGHFFWP
jgi:hypothetical protein